MSRLSLLLKELLMSVVNPLQAQMTPWLVIKFVLKVQGLPLNFTVFFFFRLRSLLDITVFCTLFHRFIHFSQESKIE